MTFYASSTEVEPNEANTEIEEIPDTYKLTQDLIDEGWEYDENRVYIPFNNCYDPNVYLSISRKKSKKVVFTYTWCHKENDGTFDNLAGFKREKMFNEEEIEAESKSSINKKLSYTGMHSGLVLNTNEGYKSFFKEVFEKIMSPGCLKVFRDENYEFPPEEEEEESEEENAYIKMIEEAIEYRENPELTDVQTAKAKKVARYIKKHGLIGYLKPKLDKLHIGEHRNIYRKTLGAFNVMRGKGSYIFETVAKAESGKSLEDEIVLSCLIPEKYIINKNSITESSFTRLSEANKKYFTRTIVNFGDLGSEKAYYKVQDVFDIIKVLITEKEYSKDLSEKSKSGYFTVKSLELEVDSIGATYSTIHNSFTKNDSQLESRTVNSTPFGADKNDIMEHILYLNTPLSEQSKNKEEAIKELVRFKCYLLSLVSFDKEIINPFGSVFIRYVNESNTPIRELKQLLEFFDAYCVLTHEHCDIINDKLVASENQLNAFFSEICLENVLIPYESNFIEMLLAKGKKTELTLIDDDSNEEELDPLNEYYNNTLEKMVLYDDEEDITHYTELNSHRQKIFVNKLMRIYKLKGNSSDHKANVFFRRSDVTRTYSNYKACRDIDDMGTLLYTLQLKGYLGKLDFKDPNTNQNIYYATSKCENITIPYKLEDGDKKEAEEYLKNIGVQ